METKQKTPVEKLKDWAKLNGFTNGNLQIIIGELEAAELYAGQTKQSEPVSVDVEQAAIDYSEMYFSGKDKAKLGFIAGSWWQSQQPASVAFFSEEEIRSFMFPAINGLYGSDCGKAFMLGADKIQNELRKRVNAVNKTKDNE